MVEGGVLMATLPQCAKCESSYAGTDFCTLCRIADLEEALREAIEYLQAEYEGCSPDNRPDLRAQAVLDGTSS